MRNKTSQETKTEGTMSASVLKSSLLYSAPPPFLPLHSLPLRKDKGQQRLGSAVKRSRFLYEGINIRAYSLSVSVGRWSKLVAPLKC